MKVTLGVLGSIPESKKALETRAQPCPYLEPLGEGREVGICLQFLRGRGKKS